MHKRPTFTVIIAPSRIRQAHHTNTAEPIFSSHTFQGWISTLVNTAPARVNTVPSHFNCQVKFFQSGLVNIDSRGFGMLFETGAACPIVPGSAVLDIDHFAWTAQLDQSLDFDQPVQGHTLDCAGFPSRAQVTVDQLTLCFAECKYV